MSSAIHMRSPVKFLCLARFSRRVCQMKKHLLFTAEKHVSSFLMPSHIRQGTCWSFRTARFRPRTAYKPRTRRDLVARYQRRSGVEGGIQAAGCERRDQLGSGSGRQCGSAPACSRSSALGRRLQLYGCHCIHKDFARGAGRHSSASSRTMAISGSVKT